MGLRKDLDTQLKAITTKLTAAEAERSFWEEKLQSAEAMYKEEKASKAAYDEKIQALKSEEFNRNMEKTNGRRPLTRKNKMLNSFGNR